MYLCFILVGYCGNVTLLKSSNEDVLGTMNFVDHDLSDMVCQHISTVALDSKTIEQPNILSRFPQSFVATVMSSTNLEGDRL